MSMSSCEMCWDTLCTCGWQYRDWTPEQLTQLIEMLEQVRDRRLRGVPDPREMYDHPQPDMKAVDYGRTLEASVPSDPWGKLLP